MSQQDKIDRAVLALLWMSRSNEWEMPNGESVWHVDKGFDMQVLERLQEQGFLSKVSKTSNFMTLHGAGEREARACFEELFGES